MRRTPLIPVVAAAFSLLATAFAPGAHAAEEEVAGGLITPLSVAVADDGTVYVSQNFAGMLTKVAPGGEPETVFTSEQGAEVGAVSVDGDHVHFATTAMGGPPAAGLWTLDAEGGATQIADLWAFEKDNNPDAKRKYGILGLDKSCKDKFTKHQRWMLAYKGIKESHPYATTTVGDTTYVADAAANAVFAVDENGAVSTLAVLPASKVTVNKGIRNALELPKCAKGATYKLEPVPTDIELGPDGNLYVTSLPGGPEVPQMGANGSIYKVVPGDGTVTAAQQGGLVSPTGLAIGPTGTAYISMLFASTVLAVPFGGSAAPFAEVAFPGDVEYADGKVYVTVTDLMNDGSMPPAGQVLSFDAN